MVKMIIFDGMPSYLTSLPQRNFDQSWPSCRDLPPLENKSLLYPLPCEQFNLVGIIKEAGNPNSKKSHKAEKSNSFQLRKVMRITGCPHENKKHYAKNMCSTCYSKKVKQNKVASCGHPEKPVFARNMCLQCYMSVYRMSKKKTDNKVI